MDPNISQATPRLSKPLFLGDGANHQFSRERRLDLRATDQAEKTIRCFTEFH